MSNQYEEYLDPCGHYMTVELNGVQKEKKTASGIIYDFDQDTNSREQRAASNATVLEVGRNCWTGFTDPDGNWAAWCEKGEKVMIAQHAGQGFAIDDNLPKEEKDQLSRQRVIKDDDVLGVWRKRKVRLMQAVKSQ